MVKQYPNSFFISLHTNSVKNSPKTSGASIDWCERNKSAKTINDFAKKLKSRMDSELDTKLKIFEDSYEESFIVTKYADIPSVLIELGYGSNKDDAEKIQSDEWLSSFADIVTDILRDKYK